MSIVLRDQARALQLNGMRVDQIARVMDVDDRTVESWLSHEPADPRAAPLSGFDTVLSAAREGAVAAIARLNDIVRHEDIQPSVAVRAANALVTAYTKLEAARPPEPEDTQAGPMTIEDLRALLMQLPPDVRASLLAPNA